MAGGGRALSRGVDGVVVKYSPPAERRDNESSSSSRFSLRTPSSVFASLLLPHRVATAIYKQQQKLPGVLGAKGRVTEEPTRRFWPACMNKSIMAWYPPLPQSGGTVSAGDGFFDDQSAGGWPLWSFFGSADGHESHNSSAGGVRAASSDEQSEAPPVRTQPTDDIFMSQFSDEEMRRMDDAPFEALDMFPGSMHQLLSYENMLSGVLTGSSEEDAGLGVDTMDTCGFPLFSHDLMQEQDAPTEAVPVPDLLAPKHDQAAPSVTKRSRSVADGGSLFLEALVLQELEDVVFQLTKRTRVCFRDAFFRLAESSRAKCSAANGKTPSSQTAAKQAAAEGSNASSSRISKPAAPGPPGYCPERETNAIDRTVADLTMKPPRTVPLEVLVSRTADGSGAEAQSATTTSTWTTTACKEEGDCLCL